MATMPTTHLSVKEIAASAIKRVESSSAAAMTCAVTSKFAKKIAEIVQEHARSTLRTKKLHLEGTMQ